ncbi:TIGR02117 family protein [Iodidimonas sp. SYSU 1G8]|uniref:TIGR02117 family protein n=1 Tax=Iodidimonas sp. SYSU 1G8 TaxID=3133967 RepID=UPI0031FECE14
MNWPRWPIRLLGAIAGTVLLYGFVAAISAFIPVNRDFRQQESGIDIFVLSNGVHVDLVLPVANHVIDWRAAGLAAGPNAVFLDFGWGEADFYLRTPTWADFDPIVGAGALLWQTDVLVHVAERTTAPRSGAVRLRLSDTQYRKLADYVRASFAPHIIQVPGASYGYGDDFYVGRGTYTAFLTCNEWLNRGLRHAGVRAALWSPLPQGVMRQVGRAG